MAEPTNTHVVSDLSQLKALSHELRQLILGTLCKEPMTTKQVAKKLGQPPTKLYHHVAILEEAGLLRLVETRQNRGTTEKYYQAVAGRFEVGETAIGKDSEGVDALFGGAFESALGDIRKLASQVGDDGKELSGMAMMARGAIDLTPEEFELFIEKISEFIAFFRENPTPRAKRHSVILAVYQQPEP